LIDEAPNTRRHPDDLEDEGDSDEEANAAAGWITEEESNPIIALKNEVILGQLNNEVAFPHEQDGENLPSNHNIAKSVPLALVEVCIFLFTCLIALYMPTNFIPYRMLLCSYS
jgi:hypothetical protein